MVGKYGPRAHISHNHSVFHLLFIIIILDLDSNTSFDRLNNYKLGIFCRACFIFAIICEWTCISIAYHNLCYLYVGTNSRETG